MKISTKIFLLALCSAVNCTAFDISARNLTGDWSGQLKVTPQMSMKLVFHIDDNAVSIDSPDQGAYGITGNLVFLSQDSVNVSIPQIMAGFAGARKDDAIKGEFMQSGMRFPLELTKGVDKPNRPQTPQPPFPYTTEELKITTDAGTIAGTLTIPENADKNTPLAILVTGSGPQNRDEELFEHKPFAVIADHLARCGVASFRYDDRGMGESTGDMMSATTADFAADAEAAVSHLKKTGRFGKTGLIGHSEGGLIAYMLGAKPETLDFVVSIAGPAVNGAEINAYQNKNALVNSGFDPMVADQFAIALLKANQYRLDNPAVMNVTDELLQEIYPQLNESSVTRKLGETISATLSLQKINPWMEYFLAYDPASDLKMLKIPALIIYGEKDCQVPPSLNLEAAHANAPHAKVKCYPDLNHMMQHAKTGDVSEYKEIEETISPEVLEAITDFLHSL
ncbi:MAG: alpha/beta hydrolase [Muribaculaceae bacterium]|nr:alpha/beta hydrolase [Muribaculaceae bacterium]